MNNLFNELDKLDITSILTETEEISLDSIKETKIDDTVKTADQVSIETVAREFSDAMAINGISDVKNYSVEQATELTESIIDRLNLKGGDKLVESVLSYIGFKQEKFSGMKLTEAEQSESIKDIQSKISALNSGLEGLDKTEEVSDNTKFEVDGKQYTKSSATREIKSLQRKLEKLNGTKNKDLDNAFGENGSESIMEDDNIEDITWIFDRWDWEFDITTKEELGSDYFYHTLVKNYSEAERFNYHSDYWGSAEDYQADVCDVVADFEPYVGEVVSINSEGGPQNYNLLGVLIDNQYNSVSHLAVLVEPAGDLKEAAINPDIDNIDQESKNKATIEKAIKIAGSKTVIDNDKFRELRTKLANRDYEVVDRLKDYALLRGEEVIYTWLRAEDEKLKENVDINITDGNINVNKDNSNISVDTVNSDVNINVMDTAPVEEPSTEEIPSEIVAVDNVDEEILADPSESGELEESLQPEYFDKFGSIVDKYLHGTGEGDSMASQVVTAINKLIYKFYNDGDIYDNSNPAGLMGGANDLSSYANWLAENIDGAKEILDRIFDLRYGDNDEYQEILIDLANNYLDSDFLSTIDNHPLEGSIYNCSGNYSFDESRNYDDEEEYYESETLNEAEDKYFITYVASEGETGETEAENVAEILKKEYANLNLEFKVRNIDASVYGVDAIGSKESVTEFIKAYAPLGEYVDNIDEAIKPYEGLDEAADQQKENSFEGTKADIMKKHPELASDPNYASYADDDWMAVDYNKDGSIKGLRLATKVTESEEYSFAEIIADMSNAETYSELYDAAGKIVDAELRNQVEELLGTCEDDGDSVDEAYSIVTSDLLDSRANDINEDFQVDNVPGKVDQGRRIELAKLESEGKISYRVSYLNESDEEIVGWDIDAEDDEEALNKLDAFADADEVADDILGQQFKDSGVDGVSSLFYKGANINLASDGESFVITIDKDGEDPVILNGETSDEVMSALILWYIMNTSDVEKGLDVVEDTIEDIEDSIDTEPAKDLEEGEILSREVIIPDDALDEISDFDEDSGKYTLKGEYANLEFEPNLDGEIGNYDDAQPFFVKGDKELVDKFIASLGLNEAEDEGITSIEVEIPYDLLDELIDSGSLVFNDETDEYTFTDSSDYSDLKFTHITEPRETNFDDTEFFTLEGDSAKISAFLDEFNLRDNI